MDGERDLTYDASGHFTGGFWHAAYLGGQRMTSISQKQSLCVSKQVKRPVPVTGNDC